VGREGKKPQNARLNEGKGGDEEMEGGGRGQTKGRNCGQEDRRRERRG
jgi:hypothetical protein